MSSEDFAERLMEEVGCGMVVLDLCPSFCIYMETEALSAVCRDALGDMDGKVVLLDGVDDVYLR